MEPEIPWTEHMWKAVKEMMDRSVHHANLSSILSADPIYVLLGHLRLHLLSGL